MLKMLRRKFRESGVFLPYKRLAALPDFLFWKLRGSPGPGVPHLIKRRAIRQYAQQFHLRVLVETGTNFGEMIQANRNLFDEVYSIELDDWRYGLAKQRFARWPSVHLLHGDSAVVLPQLMASTSQPCLFWLDAHDFDVATPVRTELECIFRHPVQDHVLLIDDAAYFGGSAAYPTLEEMREQVARERPAWILEVKEAIIRIHKPQPGSG